MCSDHFVSGCLSALFEDANPDWVPSLNLGYNTKGKGSDIKAKSGRFTRVFGRSARKRSLLEQETKLASDAEIQLPEEIDSETTCSDVHTQTDSSTYDMEGSQQQEISHLRGQLNAAKEENKMLIVHSNKLQEQIEEHSLSEASFKDDDEKVLYYTGLTTWELLEKLFVYVKPHLKQQSSLSPFQQLLVTLMRLRLNLYGQDLGYRFKVHESTISRMFDHTICILYNKLKPLIIWPTRDVLLKTMPMVFRKHCPRCVVILDCFKIFLDRPSDLLARAQTYSHYKHHNTVKYLIGVTPQGTVSYISEGWGGRTSDKYITEHCSLLQNLLPGDTVLADRGFDISDSVGFHCSILKIPTFTKGRSQLFGIEVEQTRRIANVRIHVERVIRNIRKKFSFLSATQPVDFVTSMDKSVTVLDKTVCVSCALANMCDSVVPFD